jgi:hypothetical protein
MMRHADQGRTRLGDDVIDGVQHALPVRGVETLARLVQDEGSRSQLIEAEQNVRRALS